jgi:hypothetical protein
MAFNPQIPPPPKDIKFKQPIGNHIFKLKDIEEVCSRKRPIVSENRELTFDFYGNIKSEWILWREMNFKGEEIKRNILYRTNGRFWFKSLRHRRQPERSENETRFETLRKTQQTIQIFDRTSTDKNSLVNFAHPASRKSSY